MALPHKIIQFFDRPWADRRVQMAVYAEGRLDVLMAQALAHQQERCLEMDEQRGGMPERATPPTG